MPVSNIAHRVVPRGLVGAYSTIFPTIETALSEGGVWRTGLAHGLDWTDPRVDANGARCTQSGASPPPYNDSVACLVGAFGATQDATMTVRTVNQDSASFCELEILLRFKITAHVARGYEILYDVARNYSDVVRWQGALNDFTPIIHQTGLPTLATGDRIRATVSGTNPVTFNVYRNGTLLYSVQDDGTFGGTPYTDGNPGVGMFFEQGAGAGAVTDYSITRFDVTTS